MDEEACLTAFGVVPDRQCCDGREHRTTGRVGRITPGCVPGDTTLCVDGERFQVTVAWRSANGSGAGQAVKLTEDSGYFWFFTSGNVELIVKALNACDFNARFWVFQGGLTTDWVEVQNQIARFTRTCSYDPANGLWGRSDPAPTGSPAKPLPNGSGCMPAAPTVPRPGPVINVTGRPDQPRESRHPPHAMRCTARRCSG